MAIDKFDDASSRYDDASPDDASSGYDDALPTIAQFVCSNYGAYDCCSLCGSNPCGIRLSSAVTYIGIIVLINNLI